MKIESILHPTDFSEGADQALRQSSCLARALGAKVHLLHKVIYPAPKSPSEVLEHLQNAPELERLLRAYFETPERDAQEGLARRADALRRDGIDVEITLERSRDPLEVITDCVEASKVDLVVMGTHGRTGLGKLLLGSVTEKVLRHVPADVLTLRAESAVVACDRGLGTVLVPVDFSDHSQRALGLARYLAEQIGGTLCLLHVVEPIPSPMHPQRFTSRLEADPSLAGKYQEALSSMLAEGEGEISVREGHVAGQILMGREEKGASLVVMGMRGLSGPKHFLMGSVAEKVVRFCEVPVLTVK